MLITPIRRKISKVLLRHFKNVDKIQKLLNIMIKTLYNIVCLYLNIIVNRLYYLKYCLFNNLMFYNLIILKLIKLEYLF